MKKIIALILSVIFSITLFAGCGQEPVEPVYTSDNKFEIGNWVSIPIYGSVYKIYDDDKNVIDSAVMTEELFDEIYKDMADCGLTFVYPTTATGFSGNVKSLKYADKYGMKHVLRDYSLNSYLMNTAYSQFRDGSKTKEEIATELKSTYLDQYLTCEYADDIYGFFLDDEPSIEEYPPLAFSTEIFNMVAPQYCVYVNLFPKLAGGQQLGGSKPVTYDQYINKYLETFNNDYISYDNYPLYGDGFENTWIDGTFIHNMDFIKQKLVEEAEESGKPERRFFTFLQSTGYSPSDHRPLKTTADATFQTNSFLAFGVDGYQWFTYLAPTPGAREQFTIFETPLSINMEKTDTYYYIQKANQDAQFIMPYYDNFNWRGLRYNNVRLETGINYLETSNSVITDDNVLTTYTSSDDSFCGVFSDKDGNPAYYFVNYTDPGEKIDNELDLKFEGYTRAIVLKSGVKEIVKLSGGNCKLELACGEGAFVIPYK